MQRSSQTLVEKSSLNSKKNVSKKTLCKKTVSTSIVQRFAITGVSNNIGDISNSSVTIYGCGRDYVQRRRELTPGASSSMANTQLVNLSSDEDCDSDDQSVDEQVGDEAIGDEAVGDEAVRDEEVGDEDVGDEEMGDDDSIDSEWGKDGIEVGDDDSTNNEKDLEGDEDMGGVVDSDVKLSDCKSNDSPDETDCWVECNIDQTKKDKMRVGLIFADFHAALKDYVIEEGIEILRAKNKKTRVTTVCVEEGCNWRIHAFTCNDRITFMVKTFNYEHSFGKVAKNNCATSSWIAKKFADRLKADPDLKNESMKATLIARYMIVPHDKQLYRARLIAK
ncbi:hypothetical protein NE237_003296 [Protea cynaroides]|uniref:Transposase MuDR plant domain-containing protein n=1 Tax=Protea cynaroides TaxID=273540 RepID=A0A9Q0QSG8_9MAGN|nr:hypothetical protein NE237_003296 [Protea cynaroides]